MKKVKSCGVFCMRESERKCALRELFEETGIQSTQIELDEDFCYRTTYYPKSKRYDHREVEKELVAERLDPLIGAVREHLAQELDG